MRPGPFGEIFDPFTSRAFAVVDHQLAHVYVPDERDRPRIRELLLGEPGVDRVLAGEERGEVGLDHPRAGHLVALATREAWFAYPFWLDDAVAPDYARTVDIHRKPGYDPVEMFFDPVAKGIPLDATLVRGSHGAPALDHAQRGVLLSSERGVFVEGPTADTDVAVLLHGDIVEQGPSLQVTERPQHPYTQRLLLASPLPEPDAQAERRAERRRLREEERIEGAEHRTAS